MIKWMSPLAISNASPATYSAYLISYVSLGKKLRGRSGERAYRISYCGDDFKSLAEWIKDFELC